MMKRSVCFFLIATIYFFCICGIGFSQTISHEKAEKMVKREKNASRNQLNNPSSNQSKYLNEIKTKKKILRSSVKSWYSTDPKDFEPLVGSKWFFNYAIGSSIFTDTVTFESKIKIDNSDGTVYLDCKNQFGKAGTVFYKDIPSGFGGGYGFAMVIEGQSLMDFYYFKIDSSDNTSIGEDALYFFEDKETGEYSNNYAMTGIKMDFLYSEEDMQKVINSLLEWDINNDNKIDLAETIHILRDLTLNK